jgi:hypothetical protein
MHAEAAFFQAFVLPQKRGRYIELLRTKRGREKIRAGFYHFNDLDSRFCKRVPSPQRTADGIVRILISLGAPGTSYVMSSQGELGCSRNASIRRHKRHRREGHGQRGLLRPRNSGLFRIGRRAVHLPSGSIEAVTGKMIFRSGMVINWRGSGAL